MPSQTGLTALRERVGQEIGTSEWETVSQPQIDAFAACTRDRQWIHVDTERARRDSPFGGTIAHGYLLLSLVAPTLLEVFMEPAGIKAALNYGIDKLRFVSPVKSGARVRNRIKLIGVEEKGAGRTLITTENTLEIEGEAKPALIATVLSMALD